MEHSQRRTNLFCSGYNEMFWASWDIDGGLVLFYRKTIMQYIVLPYYTFIFSMQVL